jgi:hypothetical protein
MQRPNAVLNFLLAGKPWQMTTPDNARQNQEERAKDEIGKLDGLEGDLPAFGENLVK